MIDRPEYAQEATIGDYTNIPREILAMARQYCKSKNNVNDLIVFWRKNADLGI